MHLYKRTNPWWSLVAQSYKWFLLSPTFGGHGQTHSSLSSGQHLCSSPVKNQQRRRLWSQWPLRGALSWSPSLCMLPSDSNKPISTKMLGEILKDAAQNPSHCNSTVYTLHSWSFHSTSYTWMNAVYKSPPSAAFSNRFSHQTLSALSVSLLHNKT